VASPLGTLTRMLNNLRSVYSARNEWGKAMRIVRRMLAIEPESEALKAEYEDLTRRQAVRADARRVDNEHALGVADITDEAVRRNSRCIRAGLKGDQLTRASVTGRDSAQEDRVGADEVRQRCRSIPTIPHVACDSPITTS
jgi:hypothetical protein